MIATATQANLIESNTTIGQYGMVTTEAIVDHPQHGRLYITDGYGGMDMSAGGAYRWRHGIACQLLPSDTLDALDAEHNDFCTIKQAMRKAYRDDRPMLDWPGIAVQNLAESVGL